MDDNVTRHLDTEFQQLADFTVLHYLGVDHAGHLSGVHRSVAR